MAGQQTPQDPWAHEDPTTVGTENLPAPRRTRTIALGLGLMAAILLIVAAWYLITRKPISEILPPVGPVAVPTFSYKIEDVSRPIGIAVTADGSRIYVGQTGGNRTVRIYGADGKLIGEAAPPNTTPANRIPTYLAIDPATGDLWVSDRFSGTLFIYDRDGLYRGTFDPNPPLPNWQPMGIAFDGKGHVFVGDLAKPYHQVREFTLDGKGVKNFGKEGQFSFPNGITVGPDGSLLIADGNHGRLVHLDATGKSLPGIGRGDGAGQLGLPRGVALDDAGRLYVADATGQAINVYTLDGSNAPSYGGTFGGEGISDGYFEYPFGVATDTRGRVYVADWANDRIQVWSY